MLTAMFVVMELARTTADLGGKKNIGIEHLLVAIHYFSLDND